MFRIQNRTVVCFIFLGRETVNQGKTGGRRYKASERVMASVANDALGGRNIFPEPEASPLIVPWMCQTGSDNCEVSVTAKRAKVCHTCI